jgi:hypothetical protein
MNIYYSKFSLNTYPGTPYFEAFLSPGYPLYLILQKCRAFRRLPKNLRLLAAKSKEWAHHNGRGECSDINSYYDDLGRELSQTTGRPLTDKQIDAEWGGRPDPSLATLAVTDIPLPPGGFPDPATWQPPPEPDDADKPPSLAQLRKDVSSRGVQATAEEYGISPDELARLCAAEAEWHAAAVAAAAQTHNTFRH